MLNCVTVSVSLVVLQLVAVTQVPEMNIDCKQYVIDRTIAH